jgi:hypothetical protein
MAGNNSSVLEAVLSFKLRCFSIIRVFSAASRRRRATLFYVIYIMKTIGIIKSRDSAVGIATGYGLDDRGVGFRVPVVDRIFSSPRRLDRFWGPPASYPIGTGGSFPGGKASGL